MISFSSFAQNYFRSLVELTDVISDKGKEHLPSCLTNTAFVIVYSDSTDRFLLDLISAKNMNTIILNGEKISYSEGSGAKFVEFKFAKPLERFLFPNTINNHSVSIKIAEQYVVLDGLAFSNKTYNNKYWSDAKFYRNVAGEVPFYVTNQGSMLGIDLLYGFELDGSRNERLIEFVKIYGNQKMLPVTDGQIRDEAFRDFSLAAPKIGKDKTWSFTNFINSLESPVQNTVLLLGSYKSDEDFSKLKEALASIGYSGFMLKDAPDLPIQSNCQWATKSVPVLGK